MLRRIFRKPGKVFREERVFARGYFSQVSGPVLNSLDQSFGRTFFCFSNSSPASLEISN